MANSQFSMEQTNAPTWGYKPPHLGSEMNQGGKPRGAGHDQALHDSLPLLMNQGKSTEHPECHPEGHNKKPLVLGKMMGQ